MTTFLSILFILLAINAILLVFSVNGASNKTKNSARKASDTALTKILPRESSETEYKKAV
ncbi:hypothetical protein FVB32_10580 [Flagellimonas hymeniacidonis]|uniref:Uncharacterized protein n=1 Tax=Flagellimonas hymeniacidonis TaxID=2603628 RepID=A0A5C8V0M9_9FLAO|nr:hypothetical protein FVB32_10580 [Flagellimonas hymeniacidonis]